MARVSRKNINKVKENIKTFKKNKVALYTRISNDKENSKDTIDNQIDILKRFVETKENLEVSKIYSDVGYTGTNFNRPSFIQMINDTNDGYIDCVIVKDLSRLGRNHLDTAELIFNNFISKKIRFISINDNYDSIEETQGTKKLIILLKNVMNEMYSRDISKKVKATLQTKLNNGERIGGLPSLGYLVSKDGKNYIVDEKASKVVKNIFELRLKGKSLNEITNYLNDNNILTRNNYFYSIGILNNLKYSKKIYWDRSTISRLLRNEVYIGNLVQCKTIIENNKQIKQSRANWITHENSHEPIISKDIFYKVQLLLGKSSKKYEKKGNDYEKENKYIKKLNCTCGLAYNRSKYKYKLDAVYYYHCYKCRRLLTKNNVELPPYLKGYDLDSYVFNYINKQFSLANEITNKIKLFTSTKSYKTKIENLSMSINLLEEEKNKKQSLTLKVYTDYMDNLLSKQEYEILKLSLESDIKSILKEINTLNKKITYNKFDLLLNNQWLKLFNHNDCIKQLNRDIIDNYINKIIIEPKTNKVEIICEFKDEFNKLSNSLDERRSELC